jgi:bifunctional non-homologous end joining protein LigD
MPRPDAKKKRSLATYDGKRDFEATPEPGAGTRRSRRRAGPSDRQAPLAVHGLYVVQKHAARNLHYDFRLEHDGVLLSWAVPKGPSLDPRARRLAVQVEDHPLDYADFEGEIPAGNYGAGKVEIWDRGHWSPHGEVAAGLRRGRLAFKLHGGKLEGEWHLVRLAERAPGARARPANWLLFRSPDDAGEPAAATAGTTIRPGGKRRVPPESASGTQAAELFELATPAAKPPSGDEWVHETKWDGYRLLAARRGEAVQLWSRSGADWTERLPEIAAALGKLPIHDAILDGELVAMAGRMSSFQTLQATLAERGAAARRRKLRFQVFDLLTLEGEDLRALPLVERKRRLARLFRGLPASSSLRLSRHQAGKGEERWRAACARGLEGIVSKRADAPYRAGRGRDWLKVKCEGRQEFVIVGFTRQREHEDALGALLLAVAEDGGRLAYAGRVGTGFDRKSRGDLLRRLQALATQRPPLVGAIPGESAVHWVRPHLVAEVRFTEWTADGRLRHPSFVGLREDKAARDVRRESPPALSGVANAGRTRGARRAIAATAAADTTAALATRDVNTVEGVRITHPDRRVFADSRTTKLDLARYWKEVWRWIEPHLAGRPLAFLRCPEGAASACFFQKHWPGDLSGVVPVEVAEAGGTAAPQARVASLAGLVGLTQFGVVEIHLWGARARRLEYPDRLVMDLDPGPGVAWREVVAGARLLRDLLAELGLESFPLLSGGKGVHVVAPLAPRRDWATVRAFAAALARTLAIASPERYVDRATRSRRAGRIFVDYLRNGRGATAIAPYSPRARAGGPVATPITWAELARAAPDRWSVATLPKRLAALERDPWAGYFALGQAITPAALAAVGLAVAKRQGRRVSSSGRA